MFYTFYTDRIFTLFDVFYFPQDQTVRLIYSFHPDDPVTEKDIFYHGSARRGTKSVSLLSTSLPPLSIQNNGVKILDFRNRNVRFLILLTESFHIKDEYKDMCRLSL